MRLLRASSVTPSSTLAPGVASFEFALGSSIRSTRYMGRLTLPVGRDSPPIFSPILIRGTFAQLNPRRADFGCRARRSVSERALRDTRATASCP